MINKMLLSNLESVGFCLRDLNDCVLQQNESCIRLCGVMQGRVCTQGCTQLQPKNSNAVLSQGVRLHSSMSSNYELLLIHLKNIKLALHIDTTEKLRFLTEMFEYCHLSHREQEVAIWIVQKLSNKEICKRLFISKPTLKTHLDHIYKKLTPELRAFIMQQRPDR